MNPVPSPDPRLLLERQNMGREGGTPGECGLPGELIHNPGAGCFLEVVTDLP